MGRTWVESDWDKPGYNPKNGKIKGLFNWEGQGFLASHAVTGQVVPLLSFSRPHSRAFHFAWLNFMLCFVMWFAIAPVMPTVKKVPCAAPDSDICAACAKKYPGDVMTFMGEGANADGVIGSKDAECKVCYPYEGRMRGNPGCGGLGLTGFQAKESTLVGIAGTIILRITIGAISDGVGIRRAYTVLLILSSIPGFLLAAAQDYPQVVVLRFIIGFAGASFVLTQLWTTTMFDLNCVGIANATSAGWGNLGGGVGSLVNTGIFSAMKSGGMANNDAWRASVGWSPAVIFILGVSVYLFSDDCPYGNFVDLGKTYSGNRLEEDMNSDEALKASGGEPGSIAAKSLLEAAKNWQTWVLFLCYMFSFGVELIVNGNIVSYFVTVWAMTQSNAGLVGSIFGFLNLFARTLGGWMSDWFLVRYGVRGRIHALFIQTLLMGLCLVTFSALNPDTTSTGMMIVNLVFWGILTSMTEGGTFAVVPYVLPNAVGGCAGIVGAGGNTGALLGNYLILALSGVGGPKPSRNLAFCAMGWGALASAMLCPCLWIPGVGSMFRACEAPAAQPEAPAGKQEAPAPMAPGPMPTFVPAPMGSYPMQPMAMGQPMMMMAQ